MKNSNTSDNQSALNMPLEELSINLDNANLTNPLLVESILRYGIHFLAGAIRPEIDELMNGLPNTNDLRYDPLDRHGDAYHPQSLESFLSNFIERITNTVFVYIEKACIRLSIHDTLFIINVMDGRLQRMMSEIKLIQELTAAQIDRHEARELSGDTDTQGMSWMSQMTTAIENERGPYFDLFESEVYR